MDSATRYLVAGSVFSVVTSVLWCLWGRFERSLQSFVFQIVASHFDLSYHNLRGVTNIVAIARILDQLHLRTHAYLWQHEVNVDSDDSIMTGYVRLPTQTWFLWLLSLVGISHYIWVKHDASEMVAVGPTNFLHALFRMSTDYANCEVPEEELQSLAAHLHTRIPRTLAERRCMCCERCTVVALQSILLISTATASQHWSFVVVIATSLLSFVCCWCRQALREHGAHLAFALPLCCCRRCRWWRRSHSDANDAFVEGVEALVSIGQRASELPETNDPELAAATPIDECPASAEPDMDRTHYSVVVARGHWYEVSSRHRLPLRTVHSTFELLPGMGGCRAYAIPVQKDMPHYLAARARTEHVLYVCIHNPMTETPILEMQALMKKATRTVALIVILPPLETFDEALSATSSLRIHGNAETKFVATYCDRACWLMLMTSGIFAHVGLVLPYYSPPYLKQSRAWDCARRMVDSEAFDTLPG